MIVDKAQALHSFWSSFGLTAIDEYSAYDERMDLPDNYLTYDVVTSNLGDPVAMSVNLFYRSTSWTEITQKADEIARSIGYGGKVIPITGGYIWIKLGTPFAQRIAVDQDSDLRRIYLNISVDYLTET